jgi:hypothetical protein
MLRSFFPLKLEDIIYFIIDGSMMDTGLKLSTDKVNLSTFSGFDMVPAGDVHKLQSLQKYSYEEKEIDEEERSLLNPEIGDVSGEDAESELGKEQSTDLKVSTGELDEDNPE